MTYLYVFIVGFFSLFTIHYPLLKNLTQLDRVNLQS